MRVSEVIHPLDEDALSVFAAKGIEGATEIPQKGNRNAVTVRRVIQLTRDLTGKEFGSLRILDIGCGEGVYAIEAGVRRAHIVAVDCRTERMKRGEAIARKFRLDRVRFEQADVRDITKASHGTFDVVYLLGILYHLDTPDVFKVVENVRDLVVADGLVVIDTHIAVRPDTEADYRGRRYAGWKCREHGDADSQAVRISRLLMSLDNTFSFWFAKSDLVRLLVDIGFAAVLEVHAPLEPGKRADRITLVATRGEPVVLSTYPWLNGLSEEAIEALVVPPKAAQAAPPPKRRGLPSLVNRVLRRTVGVEIRRV